MNADKLATAFTAAVRYSRAERHDDELATWRRTLHDAAGREDDLPFAVFADWIEDRGLAEQPMLQRLRSEGAHAAPMHFAQHPETGEVVEWPRHSSDSLVTNAKDLTDRRRRHYPTTHSVDGDFAVEGPGGTLSVRAQHDGRFVVQRHGIGGLRTREVGHTDSLDEGISHATRLAFPH